MVRQVCARQKTKKVKRHCKRLNLLRLCATLPAVDDFTLTCNITKQEPDQRRFWGKGYIYTTASGEQVIDHSGDVIDTPDAQAALESAFYDYMKNSREGDLEHSDFGAATLIEGWIVTEEKKNAGLFPPDMDEGIYVAFEAHDSPEGDVLWEGVKSGRLAGLSIVGEGRREPI